jgi:hypothetical protein
MFQLSSSGMRPSYPGIIVAGTLRVMTANTAAALAPRSHCCPVRSGASSRYSSMIEVVMPALTAP